MESRRACRLPEDSNLASSCWHHCDWAHSVELLRSSSVEYPSRTSCNLQMVFIADAPPSAYSMSDGRLIQLREDRQTIGRARPGGGNLGYRRKQDFASTMMADDLQAHRASSGEFVAGYRVVLE